MSAVIFCCIFHNFLFLCHKISLLSSETLLPSSFTIPIFLSFSLLKIILISLCNPTTVFLFTSSLFFVYIVQFPFLIVCLYLIFFNQKSNLSDIIFSILTVIYKLKQLLYLSALVVLYSVTVVIFIFILIVESKTLLLEVSI